MVRSRILVVASVAALMAAPVPAQPPGRITGIGGVFLKSPDPKRLMAWYRDVLGIALESWGGAKLPTDAPGHPPVVVLNAFAQGSDYFDPSRREVMINFAVDDLSAFLDRLRAKGVAVLKREDDPTGHFAWLLDPDGTKIELWQPVRPGSSKP